MKDIQEKTAFNPLDLENINLYPERLKTVSAWNEHIPFAMSIIELQKPNVVVELGTHAGISYGAFCQAITALGLGTRCYAVDTWTGDNHAGSYENDIYAEFKQYHAKYESFSKLMRMTFDEALNHVTDGSVDLLHIDGLHTYEAVAHDFRSWQRKLSPQSIVLFHDTIVTEKGFGVHLLWDELCQLYPNFNFQHGFGLGVLAVGESQIPEVKNFLEAANRNPKSMRSLYFSLGRRLQLEVWSSDLERDAVELRRIVTSREGQFADKILSPIKAVKRLLT